MKNNFIQLNYYERIELMRIAAACPKSMNNIAWYLDTLTSPRGFYDESSEAWEGLRHIRNMIWMRTHKYAGFRKFHNECVVREANEAERAERFDKLDYIIACLWGNY